MTTGAATTTGGGLSDGNGVEGWPGIVSRFQLILLAGLRSKQLFKGAHPRIPADPLKRRNTSIALEELRRGLVPFMAHNRIASEMSPTVIDTVESLTPSGTRQNFDLRNTGQVNERS
jgi:DNA-directed RNA polymerase subunit K/omega